MVFQSILGHLPERRKKRDTMDERKNKRAMMALGRSPEYHWNQIISQSVHRFSRRSRLKLFSIYSPGGHLVPHSGIVLAILSHPRNIPV